MPSPKPHSGAHTQLGYLCAATGTYSAHKAAAYRQSRCQGASPHPRTVTAAHATAQHHSHPTEQARLSVPEPEHRDTTVSQGGQIPAVSPRAVTAPLLGHDAVGHFLLQWAFSKQAAVLDRRALAEPIPCLHRDAPEQKGRPFPKELLTPSTFSGSRRVLSTGAQAERATPIPALSLLESCQTRSCNTHTWVLQEQLLIQNQTNMCVVYLKPSASCALVQAGHRSDPDFLFRLHCANKVRRTLVV